MNHFALLEIPTTDPGKAQFFFKKVFGWTFEPLLGQEDVMFMNTGHEPNALLRTVSSMPKKPGVVAHIEVDNIEEMVVAIKKSKGTIVHPITAIADLGWYAYFKTPDGCTLALWQPKKRAA
jgi:uncharacterized protein